MHKSLFQALVAVVIALPCVSVGWVEKGSFAHPVQRKVRGVRRQPPPTKKLHLKATAHSHLILINRITKWIKKDFPGHPDRHFSHLQGILLAKIPGPKLIQAVKPWLQHSNWKIRLKASYTLSLGCALLKNLTVVKRLRQMARKDLHWMVRVEAIRALGNSSSLFKSAIQKTLLQSLRHEKYWQVRAQAARTLGQLGEGSVSSPSALVEALNDSSWQVRTALATALLRLTPAPASVLKALSERLSDPEASVRQAAAYTLSRIGEQAVPALIQASTSKHRPTQKKALFALASYVGHSTHAMKVLRRALVHQDWRVAQSAAEALSLQGAQAAPALPELILLLQHPKPALRLMASWALQKLGVLALKRLRKLLQHPKSFVKIIAAETIGLLGPAAAKAAPSLVDTLLDPSWHVRREAAWALYRLGAKGGKYIPMGMIPVLINSVQDKQWSVRYGIAHTLGWMGARSRMVIGWFGQQQVSTTSVLKKLHQADPDPRVRRAARKALSRVTLKRY